MSRRCDICGKKPQTIQSRSHSKIATKRKQYPNLQSKKIDGQRVRVCTQCLKTMAKKTK